MAVEYIATSGCPLHGLDSLKPEPVLRTVSFDTADDREFSIYQCKECGLGACDPTPSAMTISELYTSRGSEQFLMEDNWFMTLLRDSYANSQLKRIFRHIKGEPLEVLDFGCGSGQISSLIKTQHPHAAIHACDFNSECPPRLLPLVKSGKVDYFTIPTFYESEKKYDLIVARNVLEHVHDPLATLRSVAKHLKPGGLLWIEVPSFETVWLNVFKGCWDGLYEPYHIFHFTSKSISLCVHEETGLEIVSLDKTNVPLIGRSIRNSLGVTYKFYLFALGILLYPLQVFIDRLFARSSSLTLVARRPI